MTTTTRSVIDEVRDNLRMPGTDQVLTDEEILRIVFKYFESQSTFTFTKYTTGVYICSLEPDTLIYGLSFTGEDEVDYQANCTGSIHVTSGSATATSISATGCLVWLRPVMVDILHFLATHRSIEAGVTVPMGTYTPRTSQEILDMASHWTGITSA